MNFDPNCELSKSETFVGCKTIRHRSLLCGVPSCPEMPDRKWTERNLPETEADDVGTACGDVFHQSYRAIRKGLAPRLYHAIEHNRVKRAPVSGRRRRDRGLLPCEIASTLPFPMEQLKGRRQPATEPPTKLRPLVDDCPIACAIRKRQAVLLITYHCSTHKPNAQPDNTRDLHSTFRHDQDSPCCDRPSASPPRASPSCGAPRPVTA
jgi:hypothetical protein